jgi:hypothetical protein
VFYILGLHHSRERQAAYQEIEIVLCFGIDGLAND